MLEYYQAFKRLKNCKRRDKPRDRQTITVAVLALIVSIAGLVYQQYQSSEISLQSDLTIHFMLMERNANILEMMVEYPDLRPFFYDNAAWPPQEPKLYSQAMTMAELWTDLFEQVIIQLENLPRDMAPTWKRYATDMYATSPAIRSYFKESCKWYVQELRNIWQCPEWQCPEHVQAGVSQPPPALPGASGGEKGKTGPAPTHRD